MNESYTRAPHRHPAADTVRHTAALLIDFDNVTMGIRSNMGQELRNFLDSDIIRGKVAVQRAYADWRRYPQYIVSLSEASVDLIFAPAYGSSKKNATDIRLAIDALELVFTRPEIETFILLSGDSDFSSLVLKLKEYGKYVIGVGLQESTSDILVQNCDEYYSYNRLSGLTSADEIQTDKRDPWELTTRAVTRMAERGDVMRSDRLKQVMLEMDPGFDERSAGFSRFNRFLGEAAQREGIVLRKRENGQYEVAPPAGGASPADGNAGRRSKTASDGESAQRSRNRRGRRGGSGRGRSRSPASKPASEPAPSPEAKASDDGLQGAYDALARAVGDLSPGGAPVRDSMAKRKLLEYDSSFDEGSVGFSKFSLFLRAAHEAGVIRMTRHDDGNHYLTPAGAGAGEKPGQQKRAQQKRAQQAQQKPDGGRGRSPFSAAAAAARKTLGRLRRGPDAEEGPAEPMDRPDAPRAAEAPRDRGTASAASRGTRQRSRQDRGSPRRDHPRPQGSRAKEEPAPAAAAGAPKPASSPPERKSQPPEQKSQPPEQKSQPPEQKSQPAVRKSQPAVRKSRSAAPRREPAARPQEPAARPAEPVGQQSEPGGSEKPAPRRTLGRYRSGSRGRAPAPRTAGRASGPRIGPISDDEVPSDGAKKEAEQETKRAAATRERGRTRRKPEGPRKPVAGPVVHMVRNYAGVGKRTAEVLFDHFGDQLFDVIDSDPQRLTEVLSGARAKIVREARRAELES
ncbi:NYN domain-containing protein [Candidatus Palauibacter sp.]|uniref:NYN domain-containing protein n=1 Tax=Candidatus Palauibacter sp. TaxID=3101350 RepID=UPI003AF2A16C